MKKKKVRKYIRAIILDDTLTMKEKLDLIMGVKVRRKKR